jgi:CxxC-x17-CxxC domain-containing protein
VYADRTIGCLNCGSEFAFTAGEQEFYAQRGFTEAPKRCPRCRAARKAQRQAGVGLGMGVGTHGTPAAYTGGYGSMSGGYQVEYRERRPRELFSAVCADCGRTASVPFRPSGVRPVYCSDCFQNRR